MLELLSPLESEPSPSEAFPENALQAAETAKDLLRLRIRSCRRRAIELNERFPFTPVSAAFERLADEMEGMLHKLDAALAARREDLLTASLFEARAWYVDALLYLDSHYTGRNDSDRLETLQSATDELRRSLRVLLYERDATRRGADFSSREDHGFAPRGGDVDGI